MTGEFKTVPKLIVTDVFHAADRFSKFDFLQQSAL
jgi:hypothetical protein